MLLVSHGSARYPDAGRAMRRHADQIRAAGHFVQVETAQLNGEPSVTDALARIATSAIRVVPFFMEDGYFSRVALPRALGGRQALMCLPVGTHDGMAGLIERHALAACDRLGVPSRAAAVLVVGHGSATAPGRALALHRHTSRVAATELFACVEAACLEEPPLVPDALLGLRAHPVVVIGFFANQAGHIRDDIPALIDAEQAIRRRTGVRDAIRFQGPVSDDPMMVRIIVDQANNGFQGE